MDPSGAMGILKKHAYLIMAHNEFQTLKKLIVLLDDYRNEYSLARG